MRLLKFLFIFLLFANVSYSNIEDSVNTNKIIKNKYKITEMTDNYLKAEKINVISKKSIVKNILINNFPYESFLDLKKEYQGITNNDIEIKVDENDSFFVKKYMDLDGGTYTRIYNVFYYKNSILFSITCVVVSLDKNENIDLSQNEELKLLNELKSFYK